MEIWHTYLYHRLAFKAKAPILKQILLSYFRLAKNLTFSHFLGDILGNTLNNLGRLLKAPYGCGEQNMVNFAPDVFVTLYLHKANRLEAATRKKAFEHFYNGYMKELQWVSLFSTLSGIVYVECTVMQVCFWSHCSCCGCLLDWHEENRPVLRKPLHLAVFTIPCWQQLLLPEEAQTHTGQLIV